MAKMYGESNTQFNDTIVVQLELILTKTLKARYSRKYYKQLTENATKIAFLSNAINNAITQKFTTFDGSACWSLVKKPAGFRFEFVDFYPLFQGIWIRTKGIADIKDVRPDIYQIMIEIIRFFNKQYYMNNMPHMLEGGIVWEHIAENLNEWEDEKERSEISVAIGRYSKNGDIYKFSEMLNRNPMSASQLIALGRKLVPAKKTDNYPEKLRQMLRNAIALIEKYPTERLGKYIHLDHKQIQLAAENGVTPNDQHYSICWDWDNFTNESSEYSDNIANNYGVIPFGHAISVKPGDPIPPRSDFPHEFNKVLKQMWDVCRKGPKVPKQKTKYKSLIEILS